MPHEHLHAGHVPEKEGKKACPHCAVKTKKWYRERLFIVSLFTGLVLIAGLFIPFLNPILSAFVDYVYLIWWALLLGFLVGGAIDYLVPNEYIRKFLSRHRKRTILYSVVFGFLMSACSHGILAIAMELYKKGASTPSVIAFLLASPWANLPITFLLFGFFGAKAFLLIVSAIIIAIITGLIYQVLDRKCIVECNKPVEEKVYSFSVREDAKKRLKNYGYTFPNILDSFKGVLKGSWSLTKMVLWWILIGIFLASLARAFITHELFMAFLGPTLLGLLITLILATIIEVCSEGSAPLSFEIFRQTGAFGNSFTFLMAGVATDYTEIGLIWSNIGKRAAILLPVITVPQILVLGYLFNVFF